MALLNHTLPLGTTAMYGLGQNLTTESEGLVNTTSILDGFPTLDEDDYDYDYNASISYIPLEELVPVSIVYGLTLLLGIIGNGLVIFAIIRFRRMQNVTNIFLTSLASADLLLVIICVPIKVSTRHKNVSFNFAF